MCGGGEWGGRTSKMERMSERIFADKRRRRMIMEMEKKDGGEDEGNEMRGKSET